MKEIKLEWLYLKKRWEELSKLEVACGLVFLRMCIDSGEVNADNEVYKLKQTVLAELVELQEKILKLETGYQGKSTGEENGYDDFN